MTKYVTHARNTNRRQFSDEHKINNILLNFWWFFSLDKSFILAFWVRWVCVRKISRKKSNLLRINAHYWAHSHSCNVSNTHVCAVRLPRSNSTRSHMSKSHSEPTEWLHSSSSVFDFFWVSFFSVFFFKRTPKNIRMCMHFRLSVTSKIRFQQKERRKKIATEYNMTKYVCYHFSLSAMYYAWDLDMVTFNDDGIIGVVCTL